jgi:hypothetical protein
MPEHIGRGPDTAGSASYNPFTSLAGEEGHCHWMVQSEYRRRAVVTGLRNLVLRVNVSAGSVPCVLSHWSVRCTRVCVLILASRGV